MIYRGSFPPPKFEHGETVYYGSTVGIIQHRRHNGRYWEYGLLINGYPGICWCTNPSSTKNSDKITVFLIDRKNLMIDFTVVDNVMEVLFTTSLRGDQAHIWGQSIFYTEGRRCMYWKDFKGFVEQLVIE